MQSALIYLSQKTGNRILKKNRLSPSSLAAVKEISLDAAVASVLNHSGRHIFIKIINMGQILHTGPFKCETTPPLIIHISKPTATHCLNYISEPSQCFVCPPCAYITAVTKPEPRRVTHPRQSPAQRVFFSHVVKSQHGGDVRVSTHTYSEL